MSLLFRPLRLELRCHNMFQLEPTCTDLNARVQVDVLDAAVDHVFGVVGRFVQ